MWRWDSGAELGGALPWARDLGLRWFWGTSWCLRMPCRGQVLLGYIHDEPVFEQFSPE